ncbi:DUF3800 domain-containing protein [Clostridium perfringens]|uniref:DUF3800 domain-containing protein n=1 Tax=Clostridium perfringens TaxID=1502 RepID=UPI0023F6AAA0|nr:DUF3800 domain-containing protein [Clostridium perfringens]WEV18640.1 DUF3800 domain-containing protein [Clostridium perfringens D]
MINIYCDESCHLENDLSDVMVLGGIACNKDEKVKIFNDIRSIKVKHNLSSWFEIKWTKVSKSKIDFYKELIDYFFNNDLKFRGVVAKNKKGLDHDKYNNGDYNEWYYKMYYLLLDHMIIPMDRYRIFIDIKDTKGGPKVEKLHEVLCNNKYDFKREVIEDIKQINSKESEILQLTDLFIGALSYKNRGLDSSESKLEIINYIENIYNKKLNQSTHRCESKFNLFVWDPREGR